MLISDFNKRTGKFVACSVVLAGLALVNSFAATNQIQLNLDHEFSGGVEPDSPNAPWVTAELLTVGNNVQFTLSAPNLAHSEFVSGFYFNFRDSLLASGCLTLSLESSSGSFNLPSIWVSKNTFKADGSGRYDILLDFATLGGANRRFTAGDSVTYTISYSDGAITAGDFAFLSTGSGGNGSFYAAAHVQNTGFHSDCSGWIGANPTELLPGPVPVPEPSALSLVALGLGGLALARARGRRATQAGNASGEFTSIF